MVLGSAGCPGGMAGGRLQLRVKADVKTGTAAVAVLVYHQNCFLLVTVSARQALAPTHQPRPPPFHAKKDHYENPRIQLSQEVFLSHNCVQQSM